MANFFDQLRTIAAQLPESHKPTLNELTGIVGALVAHAEHGDSIIKAAEQGAEQVAKVLAPEAAGVADVLAPELAPVIDAGEQLVENLPSPAPYPQTPAVTSPPIPPSDVTPIPPPTVAADVPAAATPGDPAEIQKQIEALQTELAAAQRGTVEPDSGAAA